MAPGQEAALEPVALAEDKEPRGGGAQGVYELDVGPLRLPAIHPVPAPQVRRGQAYRVAGAPLQAAEPRRLRRVGRTTQNTIRRKVNPARLCIISDQRQRQ